MRKTHTAEHSIFYFYPEHEFGSELKWVSDCLDQNPYLINWVGIDLKTTCKSQALMKFLDW